MAIGDKVFVVYLTKEVTDWDPEEGAGDERRLIFDQGGTVGGTKKALDDWLSHFGLRLKDFSVFEEDEINPSLGRRFTMNRLEDDSGDPDERGTFLADYDLYVRQLTEVEHAPTFGLPGM